MKKNIFEFISIIKNEMFSENFNLDKINNRVFVMRTAKKIFKILIAATMLFTITNVFGLEPGTGSYKLVKNFVQAFKKKDKQKILKYIILPYGGNGPCNLIDKITTPKEFLFRFDEIFDEYLYNIIIYSDLIKDWREMGWRGIMLKNGELWLDYNGKISTINYISKKRQEKILQYINNDKNKVHKSIKQFVCPVLKYKTKTYLIRIDKLNNNYYRYAEWTSNQNVQDKPRIIINNGEINFDGSGGNHHYTFKYGKYTYKFYVNVIGAKDTPLGTLEIYKDSTLLKQER